MEGDTKKLKTKEEVGKVDDDGEEALKQLVVGFAGNNQERCNKWLKVLKERDVEDLKTLKELAIGERWGSWLKKVEDDVLATKLNAWKEVLEKQQQDQAGPTLASFIPDSLCLVKDVIAPAVVVSDIDPPFLTKAWLDDHVSEICQEFCKADTEGGQYRKPPMALVRCSRGGKTRALREIAHELKESMPDCAVIRISFNDSTNLEDWEQVDPIGAVCRRIAFAAQKETSLSFKEFLVSVSKEDILKWLEDSPCVLLIDELNKLDALTDTSHKNCKDLCSFLKDTFLKPKNRYLIFSSHTVAIKPTLSVYMDSVSGRQVVVRQLPLIPSVVEAAKTLRWNDLNARDSLYYGLVPSMIFLGHLKQLPSEKRDSAIQECFDKKMVTEDKVLDLLKSFFTGKASLVPKPLLHLMNTVEEGKIRWIPGHMMQVLHEFASRGSLPQYLKLALNRIVSLFDSFCSAKNQSGDAWEALFVIVLLMRALSEQFDSQIFALKPLAFSGCSVSFQEPFDHKGKSFDSYSRVDEFVGSIVEPDRFPHIAVYYPAHAAFEEVDVIVATWPNANTRELYGYQLKEGKQLPKKKANTAFLKSWVIRGAAAQNAVEIRNWQTARVEDIEGFFGESGMHWTPKAWAELSKK